MSRNEDVPPDDRSQRTRNSDEALARSFEAEARAQEAGSRVSSFKRFLVFWTILGIVGTLLTVGFSARGMLAGKADASEMESVKQQIAEDRTKIAVFAALLDRLEKVVGRFERMISGNSGKPEQPDKERRAR